jgi:transposase
MLKRFGVQPHRAKSFKLSTDPLCVEKVTDIVGLYLKPPDNAVVLCVDEKSQIQALERTQPILPLGLGYLEGVTHDDLRHRTTTLFAALDIANGQVLTPCRARHRHQEFRAFLKHIDANVPAALDVHLVVDNYATHKHPKVRTWRADRPRFHLHYTPTYASWLNQVERWFALLTARQIRRGSVVSAKNLVTKIDAFVTAYNNNAHPFVWTASSEAIRNICARFVAPCRRLDLFAEASVAIDGAKFKAVNNRDRNFTRAKMKRRLEQIEESVERYLHQLDSADRQEPSLARTTKTVRLKDKIATLKEEMRRLEKIEARMLATPDQQISLTDRDARSMATGGKGSGMVGYNVQPRWTPNII